MEHTDKSYGVRAVRCPHLASDETVYRALKKATEPLDRAWRKLGAAGKIAIKFNQDWRLDEQVMFEGQRRQLVSHSVVRAVLELLRERTQAELICVDASYFKMYNGMSPRQTTTIGRILDEFGVRYVDGTEPPYSTCEVPQGGQMFARYVIGEELATADEVVSVAKMKNHAFMGVTLCLKNLFGLMPGAPHGRPRYYYHHLVRMPYVLADLGRILNPALNVVDALVAQAGSEWGREPDAGRVVGALVAGGHVIATDACAAWLMGHDPGADWRTDPFLRDRNALLVSDEGGFGTVDLEQIDFESEIRRRPAGEFFCRRRDPTATLAAWRRSMCEQALYYRDHRADFNDYSGRYVLLQRGEVRWHSRDGRLETSRRELAGEYPLEALFLKLVDPQEREDEHFEVYEQALAAIPR